MVAGRRAQARWEVEVSSMSSRMTYMYGYTDVLAIGPSSLN